MHHRRADVRCRAITHHRITDVSVQSNRAESRVHPMHGEGGDLLVSDVNIASQDHVHKA